MMVDLAFGLNYSFSFLKKNEPDDNDKKLLMASKNDEPDKNISSSVRK